MADVIVNSGPLIALSLIDSLDVLRGLCACVTVPEAVWHEVAGAGSTRPGADEVRRADWLVRTAVDPPPDPLPRSELDDGAAEVIVLGHRLRPRWVILDERRARRIAANVYGLPVRGTAGVLVEAKRAGLVSAVGPLLARAVQRGYFLSPRVIEEARRAAGE